MNILNKNIFEIGYILALSTIGGSILGFLFKLTIIASIATILLLTFVFTSFYLFLSFIMKQDEQTSISNNKKTSIKSTLAKEEIARKRKKHYSDQKFVALGKQNTKVYTQVKMPQETTVKEEKVVEGIRPAIEIFKENPIEELHKTKDSIIKLVDQTQATIKNIDHAFTNRMHKNTRNDIQNFLYLKTLNDALVKRLELLTDTLDQIELNGKISLKNSFNIAFGPLVIQRDSISDVNFENKASELPREKWQGSVNKTIKSLMRKRTFHQAMQVALLAK